MYRNTRFSELMKGLPRGSFEKLVAHYQADKHTKGFRSWDQLLVMIYAQLSGSRSLRDIEAGFNSQAVHHYHLGSRPVKRSTLAEANTHRASELFEALCRQLMHRAHRKLRADLQDLLYLIDSTPITLKGPGYDAWSLGNHNHRTQGLKIHMMIEAGGPLPVSLGISAPNLNDIEWGRQIQLEAGATYVFDKGYYDYNWWHQIHQQQAYFVTRFKKNAGVVVEQSRAIASGGVILADEIVKFKHRRPGGRRINHYHGTGLRRITVVRPDHPTPLVLVTNDLQRDAAQIAGLYKQRWGIELFFKWIKQNLKIKQFLGRSENAVKIQIYTALITYLLVQIYHQRTGLGETLRLCLVKLRAGLFQRPEVEQTTARRRRTRQLEYDSLQGALAL